MKQLRIILYFFFVLGSILLAQEKLVILDRDGKTSHPTVQCFMMKEDHQPGGVYRKYVMFLPEDFRNSVSMDILDPEGLLVFRGRLHTVKGRFRGQKVNAHQFLIKADYVPHTKIAFSEAVAGGEIGECRDYELSLVLPPENQPKAKHPTEHR